MAKGDWAVCRSGGMTGTIRTHAVALKSSEVPLERFRSTDVFSCPPEMKCDKLHQ